MDRPSNGGLGMQDLIQGPSTDGVKSTPPRRVYSPRGAAASSAPSNVAPSGDADAKPRHSAALYPSLSPTTPEQRRSSGDAEAASPNALDSVVALGAAIVSPIGDGLGTLQRIASIPLGSAGAAISDGVGGAFQRMASALTPDKTPEASPTKDKALYDDRQPPAPADANPRPTVDVVVP